MWARVSARQDPHTSRRYKGSRRRLENVASGYIVTGKEVPPRYVATERSYLPFMWHIMERDSRPLFSFDIDVVNG